MPDPWSVLGEMRDVVLLRQPIVEPGRYYHSRRAIVLRSGRSLEEERCSLWHELVHAERGDTVCTGWVASATERWVEREAARRAMPLAVMERRLAVASDWDDFVWHMKVPDRWVRFRLTLTHAAERARLERACRWTG
ncbi:hypothetical protein SAMN04489867_2662 [Pedococcus dokdonensis]|uniref:IrrE N-terminal-like domain-containing protein n=1 Tax=Pedococcus dokdonensis TaxID=443156 RepID=A0A1H0T871_9MICO|nr:hypothetical protein [Pedococcus dokdonensis]SDP49706.1 hypothetical protein SAMN04489867_2662 [Pedococcus dokdonensis]